MIMSGEKRNEQRSKDFFIFYPFSKEFGILGHKEKTISNVILTDNLIGQLNELTIFGSERFVYAETQHIKLCDTKFNIIEKFLPFNNKKQREWYAIPYNAFAKHINFPKLTMW